MRLINGRKNKTPITSLAALIRQMVRSSFPIKVIQLEKMNMAFGTALRDNALSSMNIWTRVMKIIRV